jgi:trehalose 6-phosphate synthase/phosphatase
MRYLMFMTDDRAVSQVVLIQVALSTTEENELQGGVIDLVGRINSRFSTLTYQPIVFLHTDDVTFSQYLALLTVADAFIVTSLREGMALRCAV